MKKLPLQGRTLALLAVIIPLLVLFIYVGLRSGPLAPVAVTVASVESRAITPALFGIGTVEARYTYKIGPTFAGRVKRLEVHVGDQVKAGQVLGEMEPVDLDARVRSQESAFKRAEAALREAEARQGVVCGRGRNPTLRLWPTIFSGKIDVFPGDRRSRLISSMTSVAPA